MQALVSEHGTTYLHAHLPLALGPDSQEVVHYPLSRLLFPALGGELWGPCSYLHAPHPTCSHSWVTMTPSGPLWLQFPLGGEVLEPLGPHPRPKT